MSSRVWFITGASSGIGRAVTEHVLRQGDIAVATLRKPSALADLAATYGPSTLLVVEADVTNYAQVSAAFAAAKDAFGRIDVVVNNAGYGIMGEFEGTREEDARKMFDVNYWGSANVLHESLRFFREANPSGAGGTVLQISAGAGVIGIPVHAHYAATKHAIEGLVESVAGELDPAWNIKLCIVEPGGFDTAVVSSMPALPIHPAYATNESLASTFMRKVVQGVRFDGDPAKLAKVLRSIVESGDIPSRLPIGLDAVSIVRSKGQRLQDTAQNTEKWSVDVRRDDAESYSSNLDAVQNGVLGGS